MYRTTTTSPYRLTQVRLKLKIGEVNDLIERLLEKDIVPNIVLRCDRVDPHARFIGCHNFLKRGR